MTTARDTSACPVLTGPNNFQIWKLRIISKLCRENVLQVVTGEELKPSPGKPTSSEDPEITWILKDEKAHEIIQDHISDALLMRTGDLTSSKELFDKLDGTLPIQDHIAKIQTIDSHISGMKLGVDTKLMAFALLQSLPCTPEWQIFQSSVINTIKENKLTFDAVEIQITAEVARQSGKAPD
ncbi:hypothetical protein SERLA73DRAFT_77329 [Serpula lacrymans var. lacrymans S7.3]|uniref:DUF4219 domain-containing protein n=2 Tax=Serpula lacrymans var. lacrymans TaxID=341189 RepID=F8Q9Q2_SERL3|nr:uncharacterized protein SERLADRAFT_442208 [Serpula lacrymans var. lacrymans S7.9]EGN95307.1 hypothetical protein SERLA73DRAFT_77329 [Serpula lacrymans var. lacrymans S7.3]EGO20835.1 hypothetical protein SERLADRAFT_442208 [Serpula lacrymans var. lacrymans S7.9]